MTLAEQRQYRLGVLYVSLSALAWSLSGLFMRSIQADLMTIICVRGLFSGTAVGLFFLYLERRRAWSILLAMRWPTLWATVLSTTGMITGLGAIYYTSVADAMVIYATLPFMTAGVAYLTIGERPSRATLIAASVALAGVLVMLGDVGNASGNSLLGKGLALAMTLSGALFATVMRKHRDVHMMPARMFSAWLCSLITIWFAAPMALAGHDVRLIMLFAVVQNALGLILYTFGSRWVPAADASLLTALEVPITPLWVWLFMNEMPSQATLIGGPIVLAALFGHIWAEMRRNRAPATA